MKTTFTAAAAVLILMLVMIATVVQSATISTGQRWHVKKHKMSSMSSSGDHGGYIVSKWHSPRNPVNPDDEYASSSKRKQVGNTSAKHHECVAHVHLYTFHGRFGIKNLSYAIL